MGEQAPQVERSAQNDLVSAVIGTYNRFEYLLNAIRSIQRQTYPNIEIIVVNDASTQAAYRNHDFGEVRIIHLEENSRKRFGYPCPGYVRTVGMKQAKGRYIAFLDDDDIWLPGKIDTQLKALEAHPDCGMCCTDGYIGRGVHDPSAQYLLYLAEHFHKVVRKIYRKRGSKLMNSGFPDVWDLEFLKVHNCVITTSAIAERDLVEKVGYMENVKIGDEDYGLWLRLLEQTNCIYVREPCFYYDLGHGAGQNY